MTMMLSPNFSLDEFLASATAHRLNIRNVPTAADIRAMQALCVNLLEPVRAHFGRPVQITSGFRCEELCLAVGSTRESQHAKGEAGDFEIAGIPNPVVAAYIRDHLPFDQVILENHVRGQTNSGWIHGSYREGRLRRQALTIMRGRTFSGLVN